MRELTGTVCLLRGSSWFASELRGIGFWSGRCAEVSRADFVLWGRCRFACEPRSRGLRELPAVTLSVAASWLERTGPRSGWNPVALGGFGLGSSWKSVMFDADQVRYSFCFGQSFRANVCLQQTRNHAGEILWSSPEAHRPSGSGLLKP